MQNALVAIAELIAARAFTNYIFQIHFCIKLQITAVHEYVTKKNVYMQLKLYLTKYRG